METHPNGMFDDRAKITDLLSTQKHLTAVYNTFCCEAATATVRNCLLSVLEDEHHIQEELFDEMNARGWYPVEKAEESKIHAAKQKFAKTVTV